MYLCIHRSIIVRIYSFSIYHKMKSSASASSSATFAERKAQKKKITGQEKKYYKNKYKYKGCPCRSEYTDTWYLFTEIGLIGCMEEPFNLKNYSNIHNPIPKKVMTRMPEDTITQLLQEGRIVTMTRLIDKLESYQTRFDVLINRHKLDEMGWKELQVCFKMMDDLHMPERIHRFIKTHCSHPTLVSNNVKGENIIDASDGSKLIPGRPGKTSYAQLLNEKGIEPRGLPTQNMRDWAEQCCDERTCVVRKSFQRTRLRLTSTKSVRSKESDPTSASKKKKTVEDFVEIITDKELNVDLKTFNAAIPFARAIVSHRELVQLRDAMEFEYLKNWYEIVQTVVGKTTGLLDNMEWYFELEADQQDCLLKRAQALSKNVEVIEGDDEFSGIFHRADIF